MTPSPAGNAEGTQSADALVESGARLLDLGRYDEASTAFTEALKIDPRNGLAHANRALVFCDTNRFPEAARDLAAATSLIPDHAIINRVRGLIALRKGDDVTAMIEFTASLAKDPVNRFALRQRARLHQQGRNAGAALADADRMIKAWPAEPDAYVFKASLLTDQHKNLAAAMLAEELSKLFPQDAYAIAAAARIYHDVGEPRRAVDAVSQAVKLEPASFYYRMLRADFRPASDLAGRRADLEAALALDAGNLLIVTKLGLVAFKEQRWSESASRFSAVLAKEPNDFGLLTYRAMAHSKASKTVQAAADYKAALLASTGPGDFNLICRSFAKENTLLDWALEACNRAIASKPTVSEFLSNRALVKLRLGQLDAAQMDYDAAINADSREAEPFLGRAVVALRMGKKESSDAYRIQAMNRDPKILDKFRDLGFTDF